MTVERLKKLSLSLSELRGEKKLNLRAKRFHSIRRSNPFEYFFITNRAIASSMQQKHTIALKNYQRFAHGSELCLNKSQQCVNVVAATTVRSMRQTIQL